MLARTLQSNGAAVGGGRPVGMFASTVDWCNSRPTACVGNAGNDSNGILVSWSKSATVTGDLGIDPVYTVP